MQQNIITLDILKRNIWKMEPETINYNIKTVSNDVCFYELYPKEVKKEWQMWEKKLSNKTEKVPKAELQMTGKTNDFENDVLLDI